MKRTKYLWTTAMVAGSILLLSYSPVNAQEAGSAEIVEERPEWIRMIRDPKVNYFEAVASYEAWKKKEEAAQKKEETSDGHEKEGQVRYRS